MNKKQIAVWVSGETADRLKQLTVEHGLPIGKIIELAVAAYSTSEGTSDDTSGGPDGKETGDCSASILARIEALEARLQALEEAGRATVAVPLNDAEMPTESAVAPVKSSPQSKGLSDAEIRAVYKANGYLFKKTIDELRAAGKGIGEPRLRRIINQPGGKS